MTHSTFKAQEQRGSVVRCYEVGLTVDERYIWRNELHHLYSKPDGFYDRLSNPQSAIYWHKWNQKQWLASPYTKHYIIDGQEMYIHFHFDGTEEEYETIAKKQNWITVNLNE